MSTGRLDCLLSRPGRRQRVLVMALAGVVQTRERMVPRPLMIHERLGTVGHQAAYPTPDIF
jgi:hypothetical protein